MSLLHFLYTYSQWHAPRTRPGLSTLESYSESKIERRLSAADGEVCPTWESVTWLLSRPVSARISSLGPLDKLLTSMIRSMGGEERDSTGDTGDRLREVGGSASPVAGVVAAGIIVRLGSRLMVALVAGSPKERRGPDKISRIEREISLGNELAPGGGGIAIWRGPEDSGVGSSSVAGD